MNRIALYIIVLFSFSACEGVFEFSPYRANVKDEYKDQNAKSLGNIFLKNAPSTTNSFSFVTIADSHIEFAHLKDAVDAINNLEDIDFVVHLGDFTDHGLMAEYEMYSDVISELNVPIITCMGNHDYLSNGGEIYKQMFGAYNFTMQYNNIKFVFFDATTFESGKRPNMNWLEQELTANHMPKIILAHIPPFDDHYSNSETHKYSQLVDTNNVIASIHGHHHNYYFDSPLGTELKFLIPGSVGKRLMGKVTIHQSNFVFEPLTF